MNENVFNDLIIVKRSGQRVSFNGAKIALAIKKAFDSVFDTYNINSVNEIYERVLEVIESEYKDRKTINVEDIQDIIEIQLKESPFTNVYESFSNYRLRRAASRETFSGKQQHKFVKAMEKLVLTANNDTNENSVDIMFKFGRTISNEFSKAYLIDSKYMRSAEDGLIFIHDLDYYALGTTKSSYIDLSKIKMRDDYMSYITRVVNNIKKEQHGEQTICAVDYVFADYILFMFKDVFKDYLQKYLDVEGLLSYMDFMGIQEVISNLTTIRYQIEKFFRFIKTERAEKIFEKAYKDTLQNVQKVFYRELCSFLDGLDENDLALYSKKIGISFGNNQTFEGKQIISGLAKIISEHHFDNIVFILKVSGNVLDFKELIQGASLIENTVAINNLHINEEDYHRDCEYLPSGNVIYSNINTNFSFSMGRVLVAMTSINLVRLALESKTTEKFMVEFDKMLDFVKNQLVQTYEYMSNKYRENFKYLFKENIFYNADKLEPTQKIKKVLRNGCLDFSLAGLSECAHYLEPNNPTMFCQNLLELATKKLKEYAEIERLNFNLCETTNHMALRHFSMIDKSIYGFVDNVTDKEYYSTIEQEINKTNNYELISKYQNQMTGGHILAITYGSNLCGLMDNLEKACQAGVSFIMLKDSDGQ